ncbi:hypothetical protein K353_05932 [Kitasatospora sp. SolWspMP-SS2h]|uniref:hypothetical protein n=1 Tax=Kitasatospora sp. SolWspMP-SS2h TaxID=1305729 RepID=UPI000DBFFD99|nr:hypothetical protein [Kitasatospora sp. SolWspMP-SS2h]RAJ32056.1 hypothetical protein K353_05932 [Kitasatospora sp. SolWspMP-SS2h]
MVPPVGACRSVSPEQCVAALRASFAEATGWTADSALLSVGAEAAQLGRVLVAERAPLLSFDGTQDGPEYGEPSLARIAASPWLLPTLGLPPLPFALVSGHPPERTGQLLRDLDAVLEQNAVVVFVESRPVPDLLSYAPAISASAFRRKRAVALAHTACTTGSFTALSFHHSAALTAARP